MREWAVFISGLDGCLPSSMLEGGAESRTRVVPSISTKNSREQIKQVSGEHFVDCRI